MSEASYVLNILPEAGFSLRLYSPAHALTPENPVMTPLAALYAESFKNWGYDYFDAQGNNRAVHYLSQTYGQPDTRVMVLAMLQGIPTGSMVIYYGSARQVAQHLIESVGANYNRDPLTDPQLRQMYHALPHAEEYQYFDLAELFFRSRTSLSPHLAAILPALKSDLLRKTYLQMETVSADFPHRAALAQELKLLLHSFRETARGHDRLWVKELHRIMGVAMVFTAIRYVSLVAGCPPGRGMGLQWTVEGTNMGRIFTRICTDPKAKRLVGITTVKLPLFGSLSELMIRDTAKREALLRMANQSAVLYQGNVRGNLAAGWHISPDYERVVITQVPLDGIAALTSNWRLYCALIRGRLPYLLRLQRSQTMQKKLQVRPGFTPKLRFRRGEPLQYHKRRPRR